MAVGLINGVLIAYLRMQPFVVTLGMLAMARSIAMVISNNKMFYEFGPDQDLFEWIGGESILGVPESGLGPHRAHHRLHPRLPLHHLGALGVRGRGKRGGGQAFRHSGRAG